MTDESASHVDSTSSSTRTSRCCELVHHGAAASTNTHAMAWLMEEDKASTETALGRTENTNDPTSLLVYASHAVLNLYQRRAVKLCDSTATRTVLWSFQESLRTSSVEKQTSQTVIITCISGSTTVNLSQAELKPLPSSHHQTSSVMVCGFSNGRIVAWKKNDKYSESSVGSPWRESVLIEPGKDDSSASSRSITVLDAAFMEPPLGSDKVTRKTTLWVVAGSSDGAVLYTFQTDNEQDSTGTFRLVSSHSLLDSSSSSTLAVSSVKIIPFDNNYTASRSIPAYGSLLVLVGTAAPRHNKIHVYHHHFSTLEESDSSHRYIGALTGHQDWITCLDWKDTCIDNAPSSLVSGNVLLASGSHDCKIRLWKMSTATTTSSQSVPVVAGDEKPQLAESTDDDDEEDDVDEDNDEEGEARLEWLYRASTNALVDGGDATSRITRVTLEALLLGHESSVTSVQWHPQPSLLLGSSAQKSQDVLLSSSMDRSIFLWTHDDQEDSIWTPLTRLGSAGGILGGSVGSSLLGYCKAVWEPNRGDCIVGHAHGGALHVWSSSISASNPEPLPGADTLVHWKATPCLTGHFAGVTDLCWEASRGDYLLTVSLDQTCRLWAPMVDSVAKNSSQESNTIWMELGRPQVHGYDLSAIVSISTLSHPHRIVTGADEKEMRMFDAPLSTLRVLHTFAGVPLPANDPLQRVERAYIPSLGLTNKASAAEGAEEDDDVVETNESAQESESVLIPLERDLGAVSIWPENLKLFGHTTELYCLTSTLSARTAGPFFSLPDPRPVDEVIVASTAKARDVDAAAIRLWNIQEGKCLQVLKGGHKSTVATLSFSPSGSYLASSGKDRRLCVWRRDPESREFSLAWAQDSAHKRIIWSVHFCPFDDHLLASGSRDGCIKLWKVGDGPEMDKDTELPVSLLHSFAPTYVGVDGKPDSVTALSFSPRPASVNGDVSVAALLAVGLESGRIELWRVPTSVTDGVPVDLQLLPASLCHISTVTKLAWKPLPIDSNDKEGTAYDYLASSSMDHGCRVFRLSCK